MSCEDKHKQVEEKDVINGLHKGEASKCVQSFLGDRLSQLSIRS